MPLEIHGTTMYHSSQYPWNYMELCNILRKSRNVSTEFYENLVSILKFGKHQLDKNERRGINVLSAAHRSELICLQIWKNVEQ